MRSEEIDWILSRGITQQYYRGTFPEDINFTFSAPYCVVTNCDSHNGAGTHWNAWFIDKTMIYFFDSYGRDIMNETLPDGYRKFIRKRHFVFNPRMVEGVFDKSCAEFCIYVLYYLCQGVAWGEIINSFDDDSSLNDVMVREFVTKLKKSYK